jgi:hypothetical protein
MLDIALRVAIVQGLSNVAEYLFVQGKASEAMEQIEISLILSGLGVLIANEDQKSIKEIVEAVGKVVDSHIIDEKIYQAIDLSFLDKLDD